MHAPPPGTPAPQLRCDGTGRILASGTSVLKASYISDFTEGLAFCCAGVTVRRKSLRCDHQQAPELNS